MRLEASHRHRVHVSPPAAHAEELIGTVEPTCAASEARAPRAAENDYRNEGQSSPLATLQTFAWACDRGDSETIKNLLCFELTGRAKAESFMATLPAEARARWSSPEAMAAELLTRDGMQRPFPATSILERAVPEATADGRVTLRLPGTPNDRTVYQKIGDQWHYVITEAAVDRYNAATSQPKAPARWSHNEVRIEGGAFSTDEMVAGNLSAEWPSEGCKRLSRGAMKPNSSNSPSLVKHRHIELDGARIFYREAGPEKAPAILLPHGYPCSSYEFRNYMPALADRWRLVAPDFPGCGYSDTPENFPYHFNGYAEFLERFTAKLGIERFAIYLHDFGSQIGLRLAIRQPERITALIIQNGDIYEDQLGPKYEPLQEYFRNPTPGAQAKLADAVSEEGFRDEFLNGAEPEYGERISPDLWTLHWGLMTPHRKGIATGIIAGLRDNLAWFPRYQAYLREHQPPTLIVWGPRDGFMPEGAARAYLRDLPNAELHLLDGGHWLLETHLAEVVALSRDFLGRALVGAHRSGANHQEQ